MGAGGESRDTDKKWFESKVVEVGVDGDANQIKVRRARGAATCAPRAVFFSARCLLIAGGIDSTSSPCGLAALSLSLCM